MTEARRILGSALLVGACLAELPACAQAAPAAPDPQAALVKEIADLRAQSGPSAPGLIGRLHVLGMLYQETEDYALAAAAFDEARFVTRVLSGLSSVDEALLLRQQIRSEEELGDPQRVWDHQLDMLTIARKHLDDVRVVPIFRDLAADRTEVLEQARAGKFPPELYIGCYFGEARPRYDDARDDRRVYMDITDSCRFGTRDVVIAKLREEILLYYADAIETFVRLGDYSSRELRDLERQALGVEYFAPYLVLPSRGNATLGPIRFSGVELECPERTLDELLAMELIGDCLEPVVHSEGHVVANVGSWVSLVRLIAYELRSDASAADRGNALVDLADWHLLSTPANRRPFEDSPNRAREVYERAYAEFHGAGDAQTWTERIFSPELPVTLPTHEPNPFAAATGASARYIEVRFDVSKYGRGERIEIVGASKDATRSEQRDLIQLIERTSFRPRFVDGKLADADPVLLRYSLPP